MLERKKYAVVPACFRTDFKKSERPYSLIDESFLVPKICDVFYKN